MFATGKHYLQSEIDNEKSILESMIERFPNILKGEIAYYETLKKEARLIAHGDTLVEFSIRFNSSYNQLIDAQTNVLIFHYYSLAIMIYAYAESSLKHICEYVGIDTKNIRANILYNYYNKLQKEYANLPKLDIVWKERESFQKMRNTITHEMRVQNHIATQDYLNNNLKKAYELLCTVLNEVLTNNNK